MKTNELLDELSDLARVWGNSKRAIDFVEAAQNRIYVIRKQYKADLDKIESLEKQLLALNEEIRKLRAEKLVDTLPKPKPVRNIFTDPREGDRFNFEGNERVIKYSNGSLHAWDEKWNVFSDIKFYPHSVGVSDIRPVPDTPEQTNQVAVQVAENAEVTKKPIYGLEECAAEESDTCFWLPSLGDKVKTFFKLVRIEGKR